ncbi:MAG: MgtC/SapB family protein, partial [Vicinamibacterales bacterium]
MPESLLALLVATLGGAAVGVERQWSGHATGPAARFAGVRTFAMLGALAGLSGRLWVWGAPLLSAVLLLAAGTLIAIAYIVASRRDIEATTEVAALVVVGAGAAAGLGQTEVASGIVAVTALLLLEKSRLHTWIARVDIQELSAAFRFAVMAVVVLPLLPAGPYGPFGGVRPRELWLLVLFFSALSFSGYLARRIVGASRGYPVAGLLGGMVSSTSVTLSFARFSRNHDGLGQPL